MSDLKESMSDLQVTLYMEELAMHGFGAEVYFNKLTSALASQENNQSHIVWLYLSTFLAHTAMISKYLKPTGTKDNGKNKVAKDRAKQLKAILKINDKAKLLTRNARDNLEHFDERIDNWIDTGKGVLQMVVDNREGYEYLSHNKNIKRVILFKELIFVSENKDGSKEEVQLRPLFLEVQKISYAASNWLGSKRSRVR